MSCFRSKRSKSPSPAESEKTNVKHDTLLRIPECRVHLVDDGEAVELAFGDFEIQRVSDEEVSLITAIKVGSELQWPLTKDEPVVKLDALHYLFTLQVKDEQPLNYGVAFAEKRRGELGKLDSFLKENSLFTAAAASSSKKKKDNLDWKEFAPAVDNYNSFLGKAIAGGTGKLVQGIFKCSNAYAKQVQKGGESILTGAAEEKSTVAVAAANQEKNIVAAKDGQRSNSKKKGSFNKSLKRARKLSKMMEKVSRKMVNVVEGATSSVLGPVVQSKAGKAFLSMAPGEVILASFDALNKILDAAEAAERQAMHATSGAVKTAVSNRYGEDAGEAAEHALATAGHCACTAWNVFKIRRAINPASAAGTGVLNASKAFKQ